MEQSQNHKIKEFKKHNHKISYESLSSLTYDSFILELWNWHCTVIVAIK